MNKPNNLRFKANILELNNQVGNDIYMELSLCILTNQTNLNGLHFSDDYIHGVVKNKERFVGIPLVVNRTKLEYGLFSKLDHELDKASKTLRTDIVGSFFDFWEEADDDGVLKLMGSARVFKRFPSTCKAVLALYEAGELEFSCEVAVYGYASQDEAKETRSVDYEFEGQVNDLFASCIVANPAEVRSKATLLIAEALDKDTQGEKTVDKNQEFNKGIKISYHGDFEVASLKFADVTDQIYNVLNPINPRSTYRDYRYWIYEAYTDYVIVEDDQDYRTYWRIGYHIENDVVVVDPQDQWVEGYRGFIPKGVDVMTLVQKASEVETELASTKETMTQKYTEELNTMEEKLKELEAQLAEANGKIVELNGLVADKQGEVATLQEKEVELNQTVATLIPFKEQVETAAKQAKQNELSARYSKILSSDTMKAEETVQAIQELNETKLNEIVVAEVTAAKANVVTPEDKEDPVITMASKPEDLITKSKRDRLYETRN